MTPAPAAAPPAPTAEAGRPARPGLAAERGPGATPGPAPRLPEALAPEGVPSFLLQLGAQAIPIPLEGDAVVKVSRSSVTVDLASLGLAFPGLRLSQLRLRLAADGKPASGQLRGEVSAPFVRGDAELEVDANGEVSGGANAVFDVEVFGKPRVSFAYQNRQLSGSVTLEGRDIKLPIPNVVVDEGRATVSFSGDQIAGTLTARFHHAALGSGDISVTVSEKGIAGTGGFSLTMPLLAGSRGDFRFDQGRLSAAVALQAAAVQVPIPGLSLSDLTGTVILDGRNISGSFGLTAAYAGLARLTVADVKVGNEGFSGARGQIEVTAPAIQGSSGTFKLDKRGRLSGGVTIQSDQIPIPALRRGRITLTLREDGGIDVAGTGRFDIKPVGGGDLSVSWSDGVFRLGVDATISVPPLQPVIVRLDYLDGQLQGEASTGITIGPLSGNVLLRYRDSTFSGEGRLAYSLGRFNGWVLIRVDPQGTISGEGEATFRLADWLTGTIGLVVHPDLNVDARGELRLPEEITVFQPWKFEQNFFHFEQEFPLWGISIPVVGSIGLIASVHADAGFRASFGPGTLRNVLAVGDVSTRAEVEPAFTISGDFHIPAGAEVVLTVGGGIGLAALIAKIEGGIDLKGVAGIYGAITLTPTFAYQNGQYSLKGEALLQAAAQLRAGIDAYARVVAGIGWFSGEVWRKDWNLAEWRFDTGWSVGVRAGIDYVLGQPFVPELKLEPVEVDPLALIKAAVPKSGEPVPAAPSAPEPVAEFKPAEGQVEGVAAAGAPPGGPTGPGTPAAAGGPALAGPAAAPAEAAPPTGAPPPETSAAPGGAAPEAAGASQPQVEPPEGLEEPAEERTVDETYLAYVYDHLEEFFQRQREETGPSDEELRRQATERARRGEPPIPPQRPEVRPPEEPREETPAAPAQPATLPPVPGDERSRGKPLSPGVRSRMETVFDTDLTAVRIHTDEAAREGARRIAAEAYTVGRDIYFGPSRDPDAGHEELLAHELAHAVQQSGEISMEVAAPTSEAEREAEEAARALRSGEKPKPVRKKREGPGILRLEANPPPSSPVIPSSGAAPDTGGSEAAGPKGGKGPKVKFTEEEIRKILESSGDPRLAGIMAGLKSKSDVARDAARQVWDTITETFQPRESVPMRWPGPDYLPHRSVMGTVQVAENERVIRHGVERTPDMETNQGRLRDLMKELPGEFGEFSRSAVGTRYPPSFDEVLDRYKAFQGEHGYAAKYPQPDEIPAGQQSSQTERNLSLNRTGAEQVYWGDNDPTKGVPAFVFTGGRWMRWPATPAGPGGGPGAAGSPEGVDAAARTIFRADYESHHVIPLWLAGGSGQQSGDRLENLVPWHRAAHQTNHAFHFEVPEDVRKATTLTDYRDFDNGTVFVIDRFESKRSPHPAGAPAVELTPEETWKASGSDKPVWMT